MRRLIVGTIVGAGLVIATFAGTGWSDPGYGPLPATTPAAVHDSGLITHVSGSDGQPLTLTVIDPREQWIGVYHVDRATGAIALMSTRKITWDIQLIEFNSGKPSPQDIRSGLPR